MHDVSTTLALSAFQTASSFDPLYLAPLRNVSGVFQYLGRYQEALSKSNEVLALEPNKPSMERTFILAQLGRREEMTTLARKPERLNTEGKLPLWQWQMTQYAIAASSNQDALAESLLNEIKLNFNSRSDSYFWKCLNDSLIPFLIRQQKFEEAIFALNKELEFDHTVPYELFLQNPYYKTVRNEPRLQEHVSRSRAKLDTTISLLEKAQQRDELPEY